jgi:hypothetical protein
MPEIHRTFASLVRCGVQLIRLDAISNYREMAAEALIGDYWSKRLQED